MTGNKIRSPLTLEDILKKKGIQTDSRGCFCATIEQRNKKQKDVLVPALVDTKRRLVLHIEPDGEAVYMDLEEDYGRSWRLWKEWPDLVDMLHADAWKPIPEYA